MINQICSQKAAIQSFPGSQLMQEQIQVNIFSQVYRQISGLRENS